MFCFTDIEKNKCFVKHCVVVYLGPKGEDLDCKMLYAMMRHLNILKYFFSESNLFEPELFTFSLDFIDSDNWNVLTLKVKY